MDIIDTSKDDVFMRLYCKVRDTAELPGAQVERPPREDHGWAWIHQGNDNYKYKRLNVEILQGSRIHDQAHDPK